MTPGLTFVYVFEYHKMHKPLTSGVFLINLINKGGVVSSKRRSLNSGLFRSNNVSLSNLERKTIEVQIISKGKLVPSAAFWVEYRGEKLPIDFIFGTPIKREIHGFPVYTTGFNLSS